MNKTSDIMRFNTLLGSAKRIVVFTGAGMSTESGISDYRSKGGLWERFQPITIQQFLNSQEDRIEYWRRKKEMYAQIQTAEPHQGHRWIVNLSQSGKWVGVITQNIDGLHQLAGSKEILELHGTNREAVCLQCRRINSFDPVYQRLLNGEAVPRCEDCEGLLKPNTISFGQALDMQTLRNAIKWTATCDLMITLGSSLVVEPAASLPLRAAQSGAKLIIINRDPTPLDEVATLSIRQPITEFLEKTAEG